MPYVLLIVSNAAKRSTISRSFPCPKVPKALLNGIRVGDCCL
ncbi:hypothetical protein JOF46_002346 [Paeniglutamicibacter psychrophenolicus]|uniref:Uncharacterized protein n=1 Tax=Paeniglutamicibacter psychrophenolicus TaxID=257454 RepID=A0ABS4WDZ2_9MICC|nr:hypothetical protein [Paeniglutamicibacter psychrophenolicus]